MTITQTITGCNNCIFTYSKTHRHHGHISKSYHCSKDKTLNINIQNDPLTGSDKSPSNAIPAKCPIN